MFYFYNVDVWLDIAITENITDCHKYEKKVLRLQKFHRWPHVMQFKTSFTSQNKKKGEYQEKQEML